MAEDPALLAEIASADVLLLVEDDAAHLGADRVVGARLAGKRLTHAELRQARPVERRVVEVADAVVPRRFDRIQRLRFGNVAKHVAERRGAEAQSSWQNILECHWSSLGEVNRMVTTRAGSRPFARMHGDSSQRGWHAAGEGLH